MSICLNYTTCNTYKLHVHLVMIILSPAVEGCTSPGGVGWGRGKGKTLGLDSGLHTYTGGVIFRAEANIGSCGLTGSLNDLNRSLYIRGLIGPPTTLNNFRI